MRILTNNPVIVSLPNGDVPCSEFEASVAISNSVAVRLVPVGPDGTEYPEQATGVVGDSSQADISEFMGTVAAALTTLVHGRS